MTLKLCNESDVGQRWQIKGGQSAQEWSVDRPCGESCVCVAHVDCLKDSFIHVDANFSSHNPWGDRIGYVIEACQLQPGISG